jgi:hypothetical protein
MTDETTQQQEQAQPAPRIEDILFSTVFYSIEMAWQHLGIRANPQTQETEMDLPSARLAIDVVAALLPVLEARFGVAEMRDLRTTVSNLQLNYIERAGKTE